MSRELRTFKRWFERSLKKMKIDFETEELFFMVNEHIDSEIIKYLEESCRPFALYPDKVVPKDKVIFVKKKKGESWYSVGPDVNELSPYREVQHEMY